MPFFIHAVCVPRSRNFLVKFLSVFVLYFQYYLVRNHALYLTLLLFYRYTAHKKYTIYFSDTKIIILHSQVTTTCAACTTCVLQIFFSTACFTSYTCIFDH